MREQSNDLLEYVDGVVYTSPSPSTEHQRISAKLHVRLFNALNGKPCEALAAPFDIVLKKEGVEGNQIVIPDLTVICDDGGLNEKNYVGVPEMIIEILSPSNQSHDLVLKLRLYQTYGVKEYWIVDPLTNTILVYRSDKTYQVVEKGTAQSDVVKGFEVEVEEIFRV